MYIRAWHTVAFVAAMSCVVTLAQIPPATWFTPASLSLSLGVAALASMATAALLGGRLKRVESLFGGLDRVYLTHKWLGISALVFASVHFTFKAGLPAWDAVSIISLPAPYTRLVRQLSLLALMLIVILALNRKIPYHVWRWWHKLSGPLFLIVVFHWLSIKSPVTLGSAAGIWLATLSALGVAAAAYKLLLYPFLSRHAEYRVVTASPSAAALHLELVPVDRPVPFTPGQFAFISMKEDGLREPHPFTIASGSAEKGHVHFVIRDLGDYTRKLIACTRAGMYADIYAPFGRFNRRPGSKREVWIGAGVGISPFIAWLSDELATDFDKVTLFYFFTPGREFPAADVLAELARRRGAEFVPVSTGPSSADFARRFADLARSTGPAEVSVSFCGPKGLLKRIRALMRENNVPDGNIRFEYFEFR